MFADDRHRVAAYEAVGTVYEQLAKSQRCLLPSTAAKQAAG